jgi:hypothetical protein
MRHAVGTILVVAALSLCGMACDRKSGDSPPAQAPESSSSTPPKSPVVDDERSAVDSFRAVADEVAKRYSQKEAPDPNTSESLPLRVYVSRDSISVRRTGDLITPFRGEVRRSACLSVPGSWFNDRKARTLLYDVVWPFNYRDAKWHHDKVTVAATVKPLKIRCWQPWGRL